jgi:hypothetical protein
MGLKRVSIDLFDLCVNLECPLAYASFAEWNPDPVISVRLIFVQLPAPTNHYNTVRRLYIVPTYRQLGTSCKP